MNLEITPQNRGYRLTAESRVPLPRDEVFAFFSNAHNLEAITPPYLRFRVVTPDPIEMQRGTLIDYRLRLRGVPLRWQSEITVWEPPARFIDEQRRGPYRWWQHEHSFVEDGNETIMTDRVDYHFLCSMLMRPLIERDLRGIFEYRAQAIAELLVQQSERQNDLKAE